MTGGEQMVEIGARVVHHDNKKVGTVIGFMKCGDPIIRWDDWEFATSLGHLDVIDAPSSTPDEKQPDMVLYDDGFDGHQDIDADLPPPVGELSPGDPDLQQAIRGMREPGATSKSWREVLGNHQDFQIVDQLLGEVLENLTAEAVELNETVGDVWTGKFLTERFYGSLEKIKDARTRLDGIKKKIPKPCTLTWREDGVGLADCSNCGKGQLYNDYNFCPDCGARNLNSGREIPDDPKNFSDTEKVVRYYTLTNRGKKAMETIDKIVGVDEDSKEEK